MEDKVYTLLTYMSILFITVLPVLYIPMHEIAQEHDSSDADTVKIAQVKIFLPAT
jgi:hypothetical protein